MQNHFKENSPITNLIDQAVGLAISLTALTLSIGTPLTHTQYVAESTHNPQRPHQKKIRVHPIITLPGVPFKKIVD